MNKFFMLMISTLIFEASSLFAMDADFINPSDYNKDYRALPVTKIYSMDHPLTGEDFTTLCKTAQDIPDGDVHFTTMYGHIYHITKENVRRNSPLISKAFLGGSKEKLNLTYDIQKQETGISHLYKLPSGEEMIFNFHRVDLSEYANFDYNPTPKNLKFVNKDLCTPAYDILPRMNSILDLTQPLTERNLKEFYAQLATNFIPGFADERASFRTSSGYVYMISNNTFQQMNDLLEPANLESSNRKIRLDYRDAPYTEEDEDGIYHVYAEALIAVPNPNFGVAGDSEKMKSHTFPQTRIYFKKVDLKDYLIDPQRSPFDASPLNDPVNTPHVPDDLSVSELSVSKFAFLNVTDDEPQTQGQGTWLSSLPSLPSFGSWWNETKK